MALEDMVSKDFEFHSEEHALKDFEQWGDTIQLHHESSALLGVKIKSRTIELILEKEDGRARSESLRRETDGLSKGEENVKGVPGGTKDPGGVSGLKFQVR